MIGFIDISTADPSKWSSFARTPLNIPLRLASVASLALCALRLTAEAQLAFTPGNLAIFQADSSSLNNTTFTIVELSATNAVSNPIQSIPISGTGTNALRTSGSAASTGYLADSNDGILLCFTAHNSTTGSPTNANTLLPRGVGTLNPNGVFTLQTTYTGGSGDQTRGAGTVDNSNWFIGDQGGVYTDGTSSPSPAGNFRSMKSFSGTMYVFQ